MPEWEEATNEELVAAAKEGNVESLSDSERDKLQVELCKRYRWKWIKPDGSVGYEPPDWR